jgi:hypothetical protein
MLLLQQHIDWDLEGEKVSGNGNNISLADGYMLFCPSSVMYSENWIFCGWGWCIKE